MRKKNSITSIETGATIAYECMCNVTLPLLNFLVFKNHYNLLQIWLVTLESTHQKFEAPAIKLSSITSDLLILEFFVWAR